MAGLARLRRRQKGYRPPSQPLRPAPSSGDRAALRQGRAPGELTNYPHFEYPQFKQVAHPSMITTALVLHLWHMLEDGGKVAPSPVTAMSSAGSSMLSGRAPSPQPSPVETGGGVTRSEERRLGKESVSKCGYWGPP